MICNRDLQTSLLLHGPAPPMAPHMMHHHSNAGKRAKTKADQLCQSSITSEWRESSQPATSQLPLASGIWCQVKTHENIPSESG
ncbi:hypothetical protein J3F83DRAFT_749890 [Trichoderma novae-zelandiae]